MKTQIRSGFEKMLGGASMQHDKEKSFGEEIRGLTNIVRSKIREKSIQQNGINVVVYDPDGTLFAGVEMSEADAATSGLASKNVKLSTYAYFKHIGAYSQLYDTYAKMSEELKRMGLKPTLPLVEIYGHWTDDESKLETEILHSLSE